jgi:hypothetical protein
VTAAAGLAVGVALVVAGVIAEVDTHRGRQVAAAAVGAGSFVLGASIAAAVTGIAR